MTDDDEPALKRQRLEINCQDPSIKVRVAPVHGVISYHHGLRIAEPTLSQL